MNGIGCLPGYSRLLRLLCLEVHMYKYFSVFLPKYLGINFRANIHAANAQLSPWLIMIEPVPILCKDTSQGHGACYRRNK